ncbi:bifunctional 4-hydroxy-2-oxoglutarate aldolase/2-dehydro-3-deoxy-phosphogluconate aldolase (plasmid) [Deinococcus metallilatus]|uniref:2-dehydro-3-deoxyphosphogluconate aldolase/(4S)-4-hydroxy-2-oxoglutarate aldolase n=1 Tax=Deinococcus metallilatus TaxID=1211322 RepID=A0ABR6MYD6_9DEIO|nr:bifunctional 4-hydroxy-2-oxoglutarate aldolase/2-dehydro-3-deoxy-phosphogluconate aldolase [Deinococcus metallilatus]MBB5296944.1 2-dehydro-3-deoxyphosphogluconate aldolase/(4S)-4-hydroxy-2-oxoglutarate aldolase [Deinococcus metallilatus]QBY06688.1 bifunctional 4-hydroxy-2-oxoglutarate aldolase/2-dehydro-3-deoxy-phosphogluconate aldolase [Deinococcus metallilatus]GMA15157.1 bifunctional 4-hydroxy-2-oxoglutarate aldolase/2-dehydro-3-deoxy-phosphogluconate aldolase [Deinococcus metallilatus]
MTPGLLDVLAADRLLPLFTPGQVEEAARRLSALTRAGVRAVELTHRSPQTLEAFRALRERFPEVLLGAGTVLGAADAEAFAQAGADFIVSPCRVPAVASVCRERGLPYLPGAGTVREVFEAQQDGAEVVKLFPGEVLGPAFVRALLGPLPQSRVLVTGGVEPTRQSVGEWLRAGALAVGLGSRLFRLDADELEARLTELLGFTRQEGTHV